MQVVSSGRDVGVIRVGIDMNKNNKFIGPGATESKDRIAALLLMSNPRSNSFATVGGTRHCGLPGPLAHIELSTVAFHFYPTRAVIRARPERNKADAAQWLYSIANHGNQMRNQSRYT